MRPDRSREADLEPKAPCGSGLTRPSCTNVGQCAPQFRALTNWSLRASCMIPSPPAPLPRGEGGDSLLPMGEGPGMRVSPFSPWEKGGG